MKKLFYGFILFLAIFLVGCNEEEIKPELDVALKEVSLIVNQEYKIKPIINTKDLVIFNSENEEIASVDDNGLVTAISGGEVNINVGIANFPDIVVKVKFIIFSSQISISGPNTVIAGETINITAVDILDTGNGVYWVSLNPKIAKISDDGLITALKPGVAHFQVFSSENGEFLEFEIIVEEATVEKIELIANIANEKIKTTASLELTHEVFPKAALQDIIWSSSNESIATINEFGIVTIYGFGIVTFTAKSVQDHNIKTDYQVEIYWDPLDLLDYLALEKTLYQKGVTAYGGTNYKVDVLGSVSNYYFGEYPFTKKLTPSGLGNMPELLMARSDVQFITVHDTGNTSPSANAQMHANYMYTGSGGAQTSWHYSVGADGIWQQIENNYAAWHAGSGSNNFLLTNTGVKAISLEKPKLDIDSLGFYTLNGERTTILAPKNGTTILSAKDINQYGVYMEIGENGNWYLNHSYFNSTYKLISNGGGNYNSISMETMVNSGSDLYLTWHYAAKLTARLLVEFDLGLERVMFHHHFSGKNCPQTLRENGLIPNFLKLVEAEYLAEKFLKGYEITFITNNPDIISQTGRVIKAPSVDTKVSYLINIKDNNGYDMSKYFYITVPAK